MAKSGLPRRLFLVFLVFVGTLSAGPVWADAPGEKAPAPKPVAAAIPEVTTQHVLRLGDRALNYTATAGTLPARSSQGEVQGEIFFVAYRMSGEASGTRPIAFVFNGGPGAASAFLHMAAIGPRRIPVNDDGSLPPGPVQLADNPLTWLAFTDLVFIDPIGTGYSLSATDNDKQLHERFFGVRQDLLSLGRMMRLYLTRNDRWSSPVYLVGESYGGFRAAALADQLQTRFGISVRGAVLISPVLQFSLQEADHYALAPWVVRLPSFAAVAGFYRDEAGAGSESDMAGFAARQHQAEDFAMKTMLPELAQGDALQQDARDALYHRLADLTGLPFALVQRHAGRVPVSVFVKELRRERGQLLSYYDGSLAGIDPHPGASHGGGADAELTKLNARLTAATVEYLRGELKVRVDRPYRVLNSAVSRGWDWRSGRDGPHGPVGVASELKAALSRNPDLRVLIAQGYYDLVTPYFASAFVMHQMHLAAPVRDHLTLKVYRGGHMLYLHRDARRQLYDDALALFRQKATAGGSE